MVRVATEGGGGNGARRNGGGLGRGGGTDTSPPPVNPDGIPIPPDEATATEQQIAALKIQVTEMVTKVGLAGATIQNLVIRLNGQNTNMVGWRNELQGMEFRLSFAGADLDTKMAEVL